MKKKGDSLVEIILAVAIFSAAAVSAIGGMNFGLMEAQSYLEVSMARNEIDAQAEALRFIHDAYVYHKTDNTASGDSYDALWNSIVSRAIDNSGANKFSRPTFNSCDEIYDVSIAGTSHLTAFNSFAIDTQALAASALDDSALVRSESDTPSFSLASTFPRLVYSIPALSEEESLYSVEGIWVYAVPEYRSSSLEKPKFYDFYINTCWNPIGGLHANTISTTIRLFNPDI